MIPMIVNAVCGSGLILAPQLFLSTSTSPWCSAALCSRWIGCLLVAVSALAIWDVLSSLRWVCAFIGFCLVVPIVWMAGTSGPYPVLNLITGLIVISMSLIHRQRGHRYNGGWKVLVARTKADFGRITWS